MTITTRPIPRHNLNGDCFRMFCQDDTGSYTAFCLEDLHDGLLGDR
ncbi:hypothetical protein OK006_10802 [Actinobacteria bacterium OK006]|nr:hypothetical protein OK006_10802 [Actinobacteria bacterium OK006]